MRLLIASVAALMILDVVGLPIAVVSDLLSRLTNLRSVLASGE